MKLKVLLIISVWFIKDAHALGTYCGLALPGDLLAGGIIAG